MIELRGIGFRHDTGPAILDDVHLRVAEGELLAVAGSTGSGKSTLLGVLTGLVPRLPTWVVSVSLALLSFLSLACGLILDTVTHGRREMKRVSYLGIPRRAPPRNY